MGTPIKFKACITDPITIAKAFPNSARAPPQITFNRYLPPANGIAYGKGVEVIGEPTVEATDSNAQFNQAPPDDDAFFNQDIEG